MEFKCNYPARYAEQSVLKPVISWGCQWDLGAQKILSWDIPILSPSYESNPGPDTLYNHWANQDIGIKRGLVSRAVIVCRGSPNSENFILSLVNSMTWLKFRSVLIFDSARFRTLLYSLSWLFMYLILKNIIVSQVCDTFYTGTCKIGCMLHLYGLVHTALTMSITTYTNTIAHT